MLVSIIIPLYNSEKYISETLDSVLYQTYPNWECIVVDDGSTDSSKEIILEYCIKDNRIKYYWQTNAGASAARNNGVKLSKGQFIQYLDSDDVIKPDKISVMLEANTNLQSNMILYSNMILGKENNIYEQIPLRFSLNFGSDVTFDQVYRRYANDLGITPGCFLFPKKVTNFAVWNENLGPAEDWDYLLQILDNGYIFRFFPEVLLLYRNTHNSYSKNITKSLKAHYTVLVFWAIKKKTNLIYFSKRCAKLYQESIAYWLLKKTDKIISPDLSEIKITSKLCFYSLLIYPITLGYLFSMALSMINNKIKKIFFHFH